VFWRRTKKNTGIPLLARVWQEDDVWNISAFDLPVVVFGDTLDEARHNFGEALQSHFEALKMTHEFKAEAHRLIRLAKEEHSLQQIPEQELVAKFDASSSALQAMGAPHELCGVR
jgi:predicted RNase H-like HicB family nuclease